MQIFHDMEAALKSEETETDTTEREGEADAERVVSSAGRADAGRGR